jgi:hypothetical protein
MVYRFEILKIIFENFGKNEEGAHLASDSSGNNARSLGPLCFTHSGTCSTIVFYSLLRGFHS